MELDDISGSGKLEELSVGDGDIEDRMELIEEDEDIEE